MSDYKCQLCKHEWMYPPARCPNCQGQSELAPAQCSASGVEAEVCADIAARQQRGIQKYGTTVSENPLSLEQWLQHAYEECLDQAIYLKKAIDVMRTQNAEVSHPAGRKPESEGMK